MSQSVQELIDLNLLNDTKIDLTIVAKNPHLSWNPITLSLNRNLSQRFVDDHPELPWNRDILKARFLSKTHLESSIDNMPNVPLIKLARHHFSCGNLHITAKFYVIDNSQGVILINFDDEYYYLCQLNINGKNPRSIPDDKRTLGLSQLTSIYTDHLINVLIHSLDKPRFQSAWSDDPKMKFKALINKLLERDPYDNCDSSIDDYKDYILKKISSITDNLYLDIVKLLCQSKYENYIDCVIPSILRLIINDSNHINSVDLATVMMVIIESDFSIERKMESIDQFIDLGNNEDDDLCNNMTTSIEEVIEGWNEFDLPSKYRIIEMIIKMNCSVIMEREEYD